MTMRWKHDEVVLPYKMLIYDIETKHALKARIWRPGEQRVCHEQLDDAAMGDGIICIAYKWYDSKDAPKILDGENMIKKFDKLARKADVCIGKNSDAFDVKHINTQRMLQGLKPYPEWFDTCDDLEKQLRKFFTFPSYSLDYISRLLGLGGKTKMVRQDWIDIDKLELFNKVRSTYKHIPDGLNTQFLLLCQVLFKETPKTIIRNGNRANKKMRIYNIKDVLDTEAVLKKVLPYIKLKKNAASLADGKSCILCGSKNFIPTKIVTGGKTRYQHFECLAHKGYAGKAPLQYDVWNNKKFGRMGP